MTAGEITSLIVGLGGLILAGLTQVLNYKARVSHFRQVIYGKQLEGYTEVVQAVNEWYQFVSHFITMNHFQLVGDPVRIELRKQAGELNHKVAMAETKWMLVLPTEFNQAVHSFRHIFNAVSAPSRFTKGYPAELVNSADPTMDLSNAYLKIVNIARKYLGTDMLAAHIPDTLGTPREET